MRVHQQGKDIHHCCEDQRPSTGHRHEHVTGMSAKPQDKTDFNFFKPAIFDSKDQIYKSVISFCC
jgi:hypothetical protein